MRILLDTNVIISGLISTKGPPGILVRSWLLESCFELITSERQIAELARAMNYKHLRVRIHPDQALNVLENLDVRAVLATELPSLEFSADPDDNVILATAVAGKADLVVSGDKRGMLGLGDVEGIAIVTARQAVKRLGLKED